MNVCNQHYYIVGTSISSASIIGQVSKHYEKDIKSSILVMDTSSSCRLTLPKDAHHHFPLLYPYLVFTIYVSKLKSFNFDIMISDTSKVIEI